MRQSLRARFRLGRLNARQTKVVRPYVVVDIYTYAGKPSHRIFTLSSRAVVTKLMFVGNVTSHAQQGTEFV